MSIVPIFLALALGFASVDGQVPGTAERSLQSTASGSPRLPVALVENRGQWPGRASHVAKIGPTTAFLEAQGWVLTSAAPNAAHEGAAVRMQFLAANSSVRVRPEGELPARWNYLSGSDASKWRYAVPGYAAVRYAGLYAGVDVRVRVAGQDLEYDLLLAPGADLAGIEMKVTGALELRLDEAGALVIDTAVGSLTQPPPKTWELEKTGARRALDCRYVVRGPDRFGFEVPGWTGERAMVVDPKLVWSTFLGGTGTNNENGVSVVTGAGGIVTICGYTNTTSFPGTANAMSPIYRGGTMDGFVAQFDPSKQGIAQLLWCTFLGGSDYETARDVSIDAAGVITVSGRTKSTDFPTSNGAYDTTHNGGYDIFVTRLDPSKTGSAQLVWSTYLGGSGDDQVAFHAQQPNGWVTVAARTQSKDFPTTPGAFQTAHNGTTDDDVCVARLDAAGANLLFSTYLGGSGSDAPFSVDVATSGITVVGGQTASTNFPTSSTAYAKTFNKDPNNPYDGFVTVLTPTFSGLLGSTYLGGKDDEAVGNVVRAANGEITVKGRTKSSDFPTTMGVLDTTHNGDFDVYVARLDATCTTLLASTFLGGAGNDGGSHFAKGLVVDALGGVTLSAGTSSMDFPVTPDAFATKYGGSTSDVFVARLDPKLEALVYSTYLGGSSIETSYGLTVDGNDVATVTGFTRSSDFPVSQGAYDTTYNGGTNDVFVSQIALSLPGVRRYGSSTPACRGQQLLYAIDEPTAGSTTFGLAGTNGPPSSVGVLLLGTKDFPAGLPVLGVKIWIDVLSPMLSFAFAANANGELSVPIPIPPGTAGAKIYGQILWLNTAACGGAGTFSASDALEIAIH